MNKTLLTLAFGLLTTSATLASPFLSVSPTFTKAQVEGQETTLGAGLSLRGGYEFLSSRYFLSGHALELEVGTSGFGFDTMPGIGKVDGRALPVFANYRFTQYFGGTASNTNGMDYWSPDFILYAGGGLGGVHVSAEKSVDAAHSFDASEFNIAAQLFLGLGVGFNDHLSLTGGYRHIFTGDLDADIAVNNQDFDTAYGLSFHVFDINLRWLW
mgnify:CR=1 FL=1